MNNNIVKDSLTVYYKANIDICLTLTIFVILLKSNILYSFIILSFYCYFYLRLTYHIYHFIKVKHIVFIYYSLLFFLYYL